MKVSGLVSSIVVCTINIWGYREADSASTIAAYRVDEWGYWKNYLAWGSATQRDD